MAGDTSGFDVPEIALLGQITVRRGTASVSGPALGGRRARVLLVALALADQPVTGERLAALLWPDEPPPTWRAALRGVVLALRTALAPLGLDGQRLIVTAPSGYLVAPGTRSDVRDAAQRIAAAEASIRQGQPAQAADLVEPATRVHGDDLLPGEDDPWLAEQRRGLDASRLRALTLLADAAGRAGEHQRAITAAGQAVAQAPLDEHVHRTLIRALDRAGDRAGAVTAYERCRALLAEQLGIDPSRETIEVYLAALRDEGASRAIGRIPPELTTFVPRDEELRALGAALAGPGLVTVTGRGGVGKTRLAQRAAHASSAFRGTTYWVALSAVTQDELTASAVATGLAVRVGTEDPAAAIGAQLAPLGRALLVLDGCEPAVDGAATLVGTLLAQCPQLTVLATSRRALGLPGERTVRVDPFPAPAPPPAGTLGALGELDALAGHPAVLLLRDRVHDSGGELSLGPETAGLIAELCSRCGGLPLALELAAAQLTAMSVGDLLDHLDDEAPDDRLRAVMQRSHALLSAQEATVFRRLAVLDGPAGLALIKQVVCDDALPEVRVVRLLRELTAYGLLGADTTRPHWRYHQDDDIRRYARGLLDDSGETRATFARLAGVIRALLPSDPRSAPAPFEAQVTDALDAVRSLLGASADGRAEHGDGLELAFRLHRYWAATNVAEGRFWLRRLLATGGDTSPWTGPAAFALGYLSYWAGDAQSALDELERAVELLDGEEGGYRARALIYLAGLADDVDRGDAAVSYVRQAVDAAASLGPDLQVAAAMGMGCVLAERADPTASRYAADAIGLCRAHGTAEQLAVTLPTAAMVAWQAGDLEAARGYVDEARPLLDGTRRIARVVLLSASAGLALADGRIGDAVEDARVADLEGRELGVERELPLLRSLLALALLAAGDPDAAAERAAAAVRAAEALSYDFPLAVCLETAALIAHRSRSGRADQLAQLLTYTADLRERGVRPVPPTLRTDVDRMREQLAGPLADLQDGVKREDAITTALALLADQADSPTAAV